MGHVRGPKENTGIVTFFTTDLYHYHCSMLPTLFYATYPRGVKGTSSSGNTDRSDQNIHVRGHSAVCKLRNEDFITSSNIILASLFFSLSTSNYSSVQFSLWAQFIESFKNLLLINVTGADTINVQCGADCQMLCPGCFIRRLA